MIIEGNQKELDAMKEFHTELTEHTIANEIEPPKEVLRKEFQQHGEV